MKGLILFLMIAVGIGFSAHDFSSYPFKSTLNDAPLYQLYWNFDNDAETISFAVRVETTGWVGLGLSLNGQMPNSDVVIGWVTDDGQTMLHDRFASTRGSPSIDTHQDWKLEHGEEEDGFTILEFSRKYVTCDDYDLPINTETARVIWSFHASADPSSEDIPHDLIHSYKGSLSLNLLGGLPSSNENPTDDLSFFDIRVDNVVIPKNETTYWCSVSRMPENLRSTTAYITKFGPLVTQGNEAHVHHLIVFMCTGLDDSHVGIEGDCENGNLPVEVQLCRGSSFLAGWAVGGEDFLYPENVAYPFGGEGYLMVELHYDNPHEVEGTLDSSGMRVWYTNTPREYDAGMITISHWITQFHVIPPNSENFISTGLMPEECTKDYIPESGINLFANFFHTHLAGHGLTLQHIRYNSECGVYEELEPIDQNLKYDFDYQQFIHLRREVLVKPGDILQLKCFYQTVNNDNVTFGGLGTREEMCTTTAAYYPRIDFQFSASQISETDFYEFLGTTRSGQQILNGEVEYVEGLNNLGWDDDLRTRFQNKLDNGTQDVACGTDFYNMVTRKMKFPEVECPYVAPDQCSDFAPPSCCERIDGAVENDATVPKMTFGLMTVVALLATVIGRQ